MLQVLLRPADLISIHRHCDPSYRGTVCPVDHDLVTGVELHGVTRQPQSAEERARRVVNGFGAIAPPGATTVLVTHGAFATQLGRLLLGDHVPTSWADFGYGEVAELVCGTGDDCGAGRWHLVGERFAPMGHAGRGRGAFA